MRTSTSRLRLYCCLLTYVLLASTLSPLPATRAEVRATGAASTASAKAVAASSARARRDAPRREGELVVRFREGVSEEAMSAVAAAGGARRKRKLRGESRVERLELQAGQDAAALAEELRLRPEVELAEPNFLIGRAQLTPDDARFAEQWALRNEGQAGGAVGSDTGAQAAWSETTGAASTVVAVLDSGVDFKHLDLAGNRWANRREKDNDRDDDHNGYEDDFDGWDWVAEEGGGARDGNGHGTAVAGLIAARGNNGAGISGVMWRAGLMSLRVLDESGTGDIADAVEAIDYAVSMGARVVNCSWGTEGESLALRDAVERAGRRGVVVVASAGNGTRDLDTTPYYPASFDLPNLISVASTDGFDGLAPFSNWGLARATVAAPGIDLLTTGRGGDYVSVSGTSFSAPLVSGVAGLVLTARPHLGSADVRRAVLEGARRVGGLQGKVAAAGVVSAPGALNVAGRLAGGNGQGGQTPRPPSGGRNNGQGVRRAAPRAPSPGGDKGLPNIEALKGRPSYVPQPPAPKIAANAPPICRDCYEATGSDREFSNARSTLANETARPEVDLGSKNFNWSLPLVNLPGRAGLDLNLALSYNSLVWVRQGNAMQYNPDTGNPSPGFQIGFPSVQKQFTDSETGQAAIMLVTGSGGRVKLRFKSANNFEATDGSYMKLVTYAGGAVLYTTDGTQYTFDNTSNSEKRCRQIKDRNGNFITVAYDASNRVSSVTDTLSRVVNFVYNGNGTLFQLTQSRGGSGHLDVLAQFEYADITIDGPYFVDDNGNLLTMHRPDVAFSALSRVWTPDGLTHVFHYTVLGQVYKISRLAPNGTELSYVWYNVPGSPEVPNIALHDAPRFTERRDWVKYGVMQESAAVSTSYATSADGSVTQVTTPDGTVYKEFFATEGWGAGLTTGTEFWVGGVKKKWTTVQWTQDDPNALYLKNPRPSETNIYDSDGNRRRMTIDYEDGYSLPTHVREWGGADGQTYLRMSVTSYELAAPYVERRVIGLPYQQIVFDGPTGAVASRRTFSYDWGSPHISTQAPSTNYADPGYVVGRGNVVRVLRYNADAPFDDNQAINERLNGYDRAGSLVWTQDALGHQTSVSYADSFSDATKDGLNTLAYPTAVTDAESYQSKTKYNYATGAVMETRRPSSGTNAQANVTYETHAFTYDLNARPKEVRNINTDFYTRLEYTDDLLTLKSYSNLKPGSPEDYSVEVYDGAGRVRLSAGHMPGRTDRFGAVKLFYDTSGRLVRRSKPTETTGDWLPVDEDAQQGGWAYTDQEYDWQGRPTRTIRPDLYTVELDYGGCGCAGGEVVTAKDEAGRRRRFSKDSLGRVVKVEELDWSQNVYSTVRYDYNSRDQLTSVRHYQGLESGGVYQQRTLQYDGHGRLWKRTTPEQGTTEYAYRADDTPEWTKDARGVKTKFTLNARHLPTLVEFDLSGVLPGQNVAATSSLTFAYDAAGNRTRMTDGAGAVDYSYDSSSRLGWEDRTFNGVGTFRTSYGYDNAGLASVTNHWGSQVSYAHDHTGAVTGVTGAGPVSAQTYASGLQYRAFGGLKALTYGNSRQLSISYDKRMRPTVWNVSGVLGTEYGYDNFHEHTGKVTFAKNLYDSRVEAADQTLDRSFEYDHVGRINWAYTGAEARAHAITGQWGQGGGPYAHAYFYDVWGNITQRLGWGGWNASVTYTYQGNRNDALQYDLSGNVTSDGAAMAYDATGQQVSSFFSGGWALGYSYDGDRLRVRKDEGGQATFYVRSSVLGGQVVVEVNAAGAWMRGHVYLGGQALAVQEDNAVSWVHEDPVTKTKKRTDASGAVTSSTLLDPWGGEVSGAWVMNAPQQRRKFTTYERTSNGRDEAQQRSYHAWLSRFDQPDPSDSSYDLTDPQSFNRYAYTANDPVNFVDPSGLIRYIGKPRVDIDPLFLRFLFFTPGGGGTGGDEGGGPQNPTVGAKATANVTSDPCAGKKGQINPNRQGGLKEGINHVSDRHIAPQGAKWQGKKSVFEFGAAFTKGQPSATKPQREQIALGMLQEAFEKGAANRLPRGDYAYSYAPFATAGGVSADFIGRDHRHNNDFTNVRTVVLDVTNCANPILVTGYPGLALPNHSATGTPTWTSVNVVIP